MTHYKLNVLSSMESPAFLKGFRDRGTWIQMFAPAELLMLIGGSATNIDVDDWERHRDYEGGYHPSQPFLRWFWEIDEQIPHEYCRRLWKATTQPGRSHGPA
ncbi:hypothetical protein DVH05_019350 [Phytophthora capsici]|nr:hypothetical protein DVH05_019350 [Phytophthora capsici]